MIGELVGARYKVIQVLGAGGFGHTYIAEDTQRPGHPRCVLKHLTFASSNPVVLQQVRRLFEAEAETLEHLGQHDQIPRLLAYFEENHQFYLVQELVDGQPLSEELIPGQHAAEATVIALLTDVLGILEFVHAQNVIHRDIKPDNLIRRRSDGRLVLIDFGAVKTIGHTVAETTGETTLSMPIYTSGYGASEQCLGRPRFSSDLYSLGMVAVQALTGLRPAQLPQDYDTSEIIWRDQAEVSDALAAIVDRMVRYHFAHRYSSATEVLHDLQQLEHGGFIDHKNRLAASASIDKTVPEPIDRHNHGSWRLPRLGKTLTRVGGAVIATFAAAFLLRNLSQPFLVPELPTNPAAATDPQSDRISLGERTLNQWQTNSSKQEGIAYLAVGNYEQAVSSLEAARKQSPGDPEILIYLNNARIGTNKAYTIAAAVPLGTTVSAAAELLRGVAQAQDEVNRAGGMGGVLLKVAIADDDNNPEVAQQLARSLANNPEILGVVGHGSSDASLAAANVYQEQQLPMIAPISSAVQLSDAGSYIFRTMPSDRLTAKTLATYLLNQLKQKKVVAFFNSNGTYSTSLKDEFKNALFYNGVELLAEYDLGRPDFDAVESLEDARTKGATAIMLASDSTVSDKAIQVIQINRKQLNVLAGDSIHSSKVLKLAGAEAAGMVLAVPVSQIQSRFQQQSATLWGNTNLVSWRTALAYDAARALIAACQIDPSRNGIQRVMSQPNFAAIGAEGSVTFLPTGDRKGNVRLVTIVPAKTGQTISYQFKPLPF